MDYNVGYVKVAKGLKCVIDYKDNEGNWKQRTKQTFQKQKDAKTWIEKTVKELQEEITLSSQLDQEYKGITFSEFRKVFMKHLKLHREHSTVLNYENTFNKFLKLNDTLLEDINQMDIQLIVDELVEYGLSRGTIMDNLMRIDRVLNAAVKQYRAISRNPIANVKDIVLPGNKSKQKMKALTKSEFSTLLEKVKPSNDYIITLLASTCGLRIGEILGLTWDNVDLENGILTVKRQWKELKKGVHGLGDLKSINSNREVPIPPRTIAALKEYKSTLKVIPLDNRLVTDKNTKSTTSRLIKKYRRLGFNISVHDLRHTYATMLIGNNVDFKTTAKLLGHSVEMTIKIYSHVNQDMIDAATLKLQNIF